MGAAESSSFLCGADWACTGLNRRGGHDPASVTTIPPSFFPARSKATSFLEAAAERSQHALRKEASPAPVAAAATDLPSLLAIDQIILQLPPATLYQRFAVTSRAFHQAARSAMEWDPYWRHWLASAMAVVIDDTRRSPVKEWRNDDRGEWFCYWSGDFDMPADREANYVFKSPLERTAADGIVVPPNSMWDNLTAATPAQDVYAVMQELMAVYNSGSADNRTIGWGDESDGQWLPFMMPWDPSSTDGGAELTPDKVLRQLDAHRELQNSICVRNVMDDYDENEEQDQGEHVLGDIRFRRAVVDFLSRYRVEDEVTERRRVAVFTAGSDKLNSVPCFAVALVRKDLVAGFVGGVVHT